MISYQLKCRDIGFDSCDFISTGNSENEIKRRFYLHTMIDHKKEFEQLEDEEIIELYDLIKRILDNQN